MRLSAVTTESDEMQVPGLLIAHERFRHAGIVTQGCFIPHLFEMWGAHIVTFDSDLDPPAFPPSDVGHPPRNYTTGLDISCPKTKTLFRAS